MEKNDALNQIGGLLDTFKDAKEYGSILNVADYDWDLLRRFAESADVGGQMTLDAVGIEQTQKRLQMLIDIGEVMARKYEVVATNPPYMGNGGMDKKLSEFVQKNYSEGRSDLFASFMIKCNVFCKDRFFFAMITQQAWMFHTSFKRLRNEILKSDIINLLHLGTRAFDEIAGEVVQTASFVIRKRSILNYKSLYKRLLDEQGESQKQLAFFLPDHTYISNASNYQTLPDNQIAYWVSGSVIQLLSSRPNVSEYGSALNGLSTSDNEKFLRLWQEVSIKNVKFDYKSCEETIDGKYKWVPHNKGGSYRRWYGNRDYLVNWQFDGREIKIAVVNNPTDSNTTSWTRRIFNWKYFFKDGITWSDVATGKLACRYVPSGVIFNATGPTLFVNDKSDEDYFLGYFNSKIFQMFLSLVWAGIYGSS